MLAFLNFRSYGTLGQIFGLILSCLTSGLSGSGWEVFERISR